MKTIIVFLLVILALDSCQQSKSDDGENLKLTLTDYFDGIKNKDIKKMNQVTTADFIIYEDGKVWNNDSLIKVLNTFPKFTAKYTFDGFRINVDNTSGSMSYFNHGDFTLKDTTKMTFDWIESATFKKIDGKWIIDFLHSTIRKK